MINGEEDTINVLAHATNFKGEFNNIKMIDYHFMPYIEINSFFEY